MLADLFLTIAGHRVTATSSVRDLGVVLDSTLSIQAHVGQVTKSCYYQLRNIGQIRRSINEGACKTLVHALVTSRIDYCNSVLYGLPQTAVQRLQRVQNCAARIVSRTKKYDHITPVLPKLHWLPIVASIRQQFLYRVKLTRDNLTRDKNPLRLHGTTGLYNGQVQSPLLLMVVG